MLTRLTVENYALIERLDIEFARGLNIVTGETGAGKSILLGALSLLLGAKAEAGVIADQSRNCVVEGTFSVAGYNLQPLFEAADVDCDEQAVVRRVIAPGGKSRAFINDVPVQLTTLKEIVLKLIDIHSQHQSLAIGDEGFRIEAIDTLAAHPELLARYREVYAELLAREKELARLHSEAAASRKDEEYLRFQSEQLVAAALKEGEQAELEAIRTELAHAEKIREELSAAIAAIDGEDTGALTLLRNARGSLSRIEAVYSRSATLAPRIESLHIELKDILTELVAGLERIDADPERLERADERLSMLYSLQQKHRVASEAELIALRDDFVRRLALVESFDEAVAGTERTVNALREKASGLAAEIGKGRRKAAARVEKHVAEILRRLGMTDAQFSISVNVKEQLSSTGSDTVDFLFSANRNMAPQRAEKTASGGELSRLMLAIKSLVAKSIKLPTIIFDEIDSGVSGRIADDMGEIIVELAGAMQVVNITHLPQVASKGERHLLVYKENSRTFIRRLSREERVAEIAKMLSGNTVTDAAMEQARLLLG
ncbi:MAG: DNA repair protein RecN [Rikenellaceae bacterium]|jgi:DNA repair protein RecN (Recombination protein N)|nr:DNA repair protein RecN [Rikenellaceae bacterium]